MGRLYKAKIDSIRELSEQGYLQKEVAEKVGVHVKTVRKYTASSGCSISRSGVSENIPESVRNVIASILDYIDLIESALQLDKNRNVHCPRCLEGEFDFDAVKMFYVCRKCGHRLDTPFDICRKCFTVNNILKDRTGGIYTCKECGHELHKGRSRDN